MDAASQLQAVLLPLGKNICVAESLTAGRLQAAIAAASGASHYFVGGVTAYNIDQKVTLLSVDRQQAAAVDCVSEEVARQMAAGARRLFGAAIGVATTGYAEPLAEPPVPQPFAYYAIDVDGVATSGRIDATGLDRVAVQQHVADLVLRKLLDRLQTKGSSG